MLISNSLPAITHNNFARSKTTNAESVTLLAPGDVYVPSQPNEVSVTASGGALGLLAGGGAAALINNLTGGFGGAALAVGLVVAGGIGGAVLGNKAYQAAFA